jgi:hypothetical protein
MAVSVSGIIHRLWCLVILCGLILLVVLYLWSLEVEGPSAGQTSNAVNSRLLLQKLWDLPTPHTGTTQSASQLPLSAAHLLSDLEPSIDKSPSLSEAMIIEVQKKLPSLPIAYWNRHKDTPMFYMNESCAKFPSIFDLDFTNIYWQSLHTSNGTFQLLGAYYDVRQIAR